MSKCYVLSTLVLATTAGFAMAAPVLDGKNTTGDGYVLRWTQNTPTGFGDNVAGAGAGAPSVGNPRDVTAGIELRIPIADIGYSGSGPIRISAFVASGGNNFMSNQVLGGLPLNAPNLGNPRAVNFNNSANNQFVTITPTAAASAPTINGLRDTVYPTYAANSPFLQTNYTGFGKADHGQPIAGVAPTNNGSEIDAIYAVTNGGILYLFIAGNLEANGNNLSLFFDTVAGGQNRLLGGNTRPLAGDPVAGAFQVNNLSDDGSGNGLTFDTGFEPDYAIVINGSNVAVDPAPADYRLFIDYCTLPTAGAGILQSLGYFGYGTPGTGTAADAGAPAIVATVNNSNVQGVVGDLVGSSITAPNRDFAFGSEIDGVWSTIDIPNNRLYLLITGNIERNFNKMDLFIDAGPGGQNQLRGRSRNVTTSIGTVRYPGNVDIDFGGLTRMGAGDPPGAGTDTFVVEADPINAPGVLSQTNGLRFDADFAADYWMAIANGDFGNDRLIRNFGNAAVLRTGGRREDFNNRAQDYGSFDGGLKSTFDPIFFSGPGFVGLDAGTDNLTIQYPPRLIADADQFSPGFLPGNFGGSILISIDNSNVAGVTGGSVSNPLGGPETVQTGVEISIKLDELGWDGSSPIKLAGFINNSGHGFVSNQVIGGLPAAANLGEPRNVNFASLAGTQFVVVATVGGCNPADIAGSGASYDPSTGTVDVGADQQLGFDDFSIFLAAFSDGTGCPGTGPCNPADIAGSGASYDPSTGTVDVGPDGELSFEDFQVFLAAFSDSTGCQ